MQQDLKKFIDYVVKGFSKQFTSEQSAKCFCALCEDNAKALAPFAPEIIENSICLPLTFL